MILHPGKEDGQVGDGGFKLSYENPHFDSLSGPLLLVIVRTSIACRGRILIDGGQEGEDGDHLLAPFRPYLPACLPTPLLADRKRQTMGSFCQHRASAQLGSRPQNLALCLWPYLPTCLPSALPLSFPPPCSLLPPSLPSFLRPCLPACLRPSLPPCLPPSSHPAFPPLPFFTLSLSLT